MQSRVGVQEGAGSRGVDDVVAQAEFLDEREHEVAPTERESAFNRKPVWQRMLIVAAGPIANLLLCVLLFWIALQLGRPEFAPQLGETRGFFGKVIQAGWHERSIRLVCSGEVDASAIDCQVLAVALREHPELAAQVRVIDSFGPSTIQPLVVSRRLPRPLKEGILSAVLELNDDPEARHCYSHGFIERFVPVSDGHYDDRRAMRHACEQAGFLSL